MPTAAQLLKKYQAYSDEELLERIQQIEGYAPEAQTVLQQVLEQRGGQEALEQRLATNPDPSIQEDALKSQVHALLKKGIAESDLHDHLSPHFKTIANWKALVEQITEDVNRNKKDQKITVRTVVGGIFGMVLGGTVGGWLLAYITLLLEDLQLLLLPVVLAICFGAVWLFTQQSKNNILVIAFTLISFTLALRIGISLL